MDTTNNDTARLREIVELRMDNAVLRGRLQSLRIEYDEKQTLAMRACFELDHLRAQLAMAREVLDVAMRWGIVNPAYTHERIVEAIDKLDGKELRT